MNTQNNATAQNGARKHTLSNGKTQLCHVVDVIGGAEDQLLVATFGDSLLIVIHRKLVIEAGAFEKQDFESICVDNARLLAWLQTEGLTVPRAFTEALACGTLGAPRSWHATFNDVLGLADRQYTVRWRLSCDDAHTENCDTVSTVGDAFEILGNEGAMQARPGNSGSVWLGSVQLYSTRFSSSGLDRSDSQIDPSMQTKEERLLELIEAYERGLQDGSVITGTLQVAESIE